VTATYTETLAASVFAFVVQLSYLGDAARSELASASFGMEASWAWFEIHHQNRHQRRRPHHAFGSSFTNKVATTVFSFSDTQRLRATALFRGQLSWPAYRGERRRFTNQQLAIFPRQHSFRRCWHRNTGKTDHPITLVDAIQQLPGWVPGGGNKQTNTDRSYGGKSHQVFDIAALRQGFPPRSFKG